MMFDRSTIVSTSVYNILQSANHPMSVQMILNELNKQSIIPNKATVYRILKKLKDKNAINEFSVRNGGSFFEITKHHHHHFICNECDVAYCLPGCNMETQKINIGDLLPNANFKAESHDFNIYGTCEPCSSQLESNSS